MKDTRTKAQRVCDIINTFWDQLTDEAKRMIDGTDLQTMELLEGMDAMDINQIARELAILDAMEAYYDLLQN